jgi:hypothetical protein
MVVKVVVYRTNGNEMELARLQVNAGLNIAIYFLPLIRGDTGLQIRFLGREQEQHQLAR